MLHYIPIHLEILPKCIAIRAQYMNVCIKMKGIALEALIIIKIFLYKDDKGLH